MLKPTFSKSSPEREAWRDRRLSDEEGGGRWRNEHILLVAGNGLGGRRWEGDERGVWRGFTGKEIMHGISEIRVENVTRLASLMALILSSVLKQQRKKPHPCKKEEFEECLHRA
jgi:hypothetical protein